MKVEETEEEEENEEEEDCFSSQWRERDFHNYNF